MPYAIFLTSIQLLINYQQRITILHVTLYSLKKVTEATKKRQDGELPHTQEEMQDIPN